MTNESIKRALVVDDIPVNSKLAVALLAKLGWEAASVGGGVSALDWLASHPPVDLVLLDISMPDLNGEEVCRRLRADPDFAGLAIVAYTAHALSADVQRFLAHGFDGVLLKPVSLQGLRDVIAALERR
ncbi:response regulator [Propionivibrio limicola]|uniref:response regulator n=1 Tax=Propionivibrio limicola TaxID=167645 RepID=UPI0012927792|nr:response regulator [Propionivibrio limicola]